jgi:hypothetical protein
VKMLLATLLTIMTFFKILLSTYSVVLNSRGLLFFQCDCLDPINDTRVYDFGMVEVKHECRYSGSNLLLAHEAQQVYYLSYLHPSLKNWWVIYKVNPEMHTHRYDEYIERHEDDDIY